MGGAGVFGTSTVALGVAAAGLEGSAEPRDSLDEDCGTTGAEDPSRLPTPYPPANPTERPRTRASTSGHTLEGLDFGTSGQPSAEKSDEVVIGAAKSSATGGCRSA